MTALPRRSHLFQSHPLQVYSSFLIFLPRGSLVLAAYWESRLPHSCDIQGIERTSDAHKRVLGHENAVEAVAFSPCSQLVAVFTAADQIHIWHAMSGVPKCTLTMGADWKPIIPDRVIQFSPKSDFMVAACLGQTGVWLWNLMSDADNGVLLECNARSPPKRVVFIDDTHFTVAFENSMTCTWSVDYRSVTAARTFHPLASNQDDQNWVKGLQFTELSPDGRILVTMAKADDWAVHLWDIASERSLPTVHDPAGKHRLSDRSGLCFSPDGTILATWSWSQAHTNIWLLNTVSGRTSQVLRCEGTGIACRPVFSPDSATLATADALGGVLLWQVSSGESRMLSIDISDGGKPHLLSWTPDGRWLTVAFSAGRMVLCDVRTGEFSQLLPDTNFPSLRVPPLFSPDGQILASVRGTDLQLYDIQTLLHPTKRESPREPHAGNDIKLACSSDGQTLASASTQDSSIVLWSVADWRVRKRIQLPRDLSRVAALAISPDGKRIAAASKLDDPEAYQFYTWWTATGEETQTIEEDGFSDVLALCFSPEGYITALAQSSADYFPLLWFWDPTTSAERATRARMLPPRVYDQDGATFSRSGRVSFARSMGYCHLFDAETGKQLHSGPVHHDKLHSFDTQCGLRLNTDQGFLWIPPDSRAGKILATHDCFCEHHEDNSQLGWSVSRHWLCHDGRRCILLPPDYHETALLAHGSTLFVGCRNGRVLKVTSIESKNQNDD